MIRCPPAKIDNRLNAMMVSLKEDYPHINESDVIRWGVIELKNSPNTFYVPEKPMTYNSPTVLLPEDDMEFLENRRKKYGITISQSIRDSIYVAYHTKKIKK